LHREAKARKDSGDASYESQHQDWSKVAQAYEKRYHEDPTLLHALAVAKSWQNAGQHEKASAAFLSAARHHGKEMSDEQFQQVNDAAGQNFQEGNQARIAAEKRESQKVESGGTMRSPRATLEAYQKAWDRRDEIPDALAGAARNITSGKVVEMMKGPPEDRGQQHTISPPQDVSRIRNTPIFSNPDRRMQPLQSPGPTIEYKDLDVFPNLRKPAG